MLSITAKFFYELISEYLGDLREYKIILSDYRSFLSIHLSANIWEICGSIK